LKLELTINPGERHTLELSPQPDGSFTLTVEVVPNPSAPLRVKVLETDKHVRFQAASIRSFEEAARERDEKTMP
jgi:hypothetical protein